MDIAPGFWPRDFDSELADDKLMPKRGQRADVYIESTTVFVQDLSYYVLWYPQDSQFNGWDDNKAEIEGTQVVQCRLLWLESYPFSDKEINAFADKCLVSKKAKKYRSQVISVTPILEFCQHYESNARYSFISCLYENGTSITLWEESKKYWKVSFDNGMVYLSGCVSECRFWAIIQITEDDRYFVKFHEHYDPSLDECVLINYELKGKELRIFKSAIEMAISHNIVG